MQPVDQISENKLTQTIPLICVRFYYLFGHIIMYSLVHIILRFHLSIIIIHYMFGFMVITYPCHKKLPCTERQKK